MTRIAGLRCGARGALRLGAPAVLAWLCVAVGVGGNVPPGGGSTPQASPRVKAELEAVLQEFGDQPTPFMVEFQDTPEARASLLELCDDWKRNPWEYAKRYDLPRVGQGAFACHFSLAGLCRRTFRNTVTGLAGTFRPSFLAALIERCLPNHVIHVESDLLVSTSARPVRQLAAPPGGNGPLPWNLDRLDQRALPLDGEYNNADKSTDLTAQGEGVTVYVVDSGIRATHDEFQLNDDRSRILPGWDFILDAESNGEDCDGHGTHVAGTIAGRNVGVAPKANVVSVRALDCQGNGRTSDVVAALDWIAEHARHPAVVTLALGIPVGEWSKVLEQAVTSMSEEHNMLVIVAAGNTRGDACQISPANIAQTLTVAATSVPPQFRMPGGGTSRGAPGYDVIYSWSATGACVDVFAPGVDIFSACGGANRCDAPGDSAYATSSGTSMAAPAATGVAALLLAKHPFASPAELKELIMSMSTPGVVRGRVLPATPNKLLFSGDTGSMVSETRPIALVRAASGPEAYEEALVVYRNGALADGWELTSWDAKVLNTAEAEQAAAPSPPDDKHAVRIEASGFGGVALTAPLGMYFGGQSCTLALEVHQAPSVQMRLVTEAGSASRIVPLPESPEADWLLVRIPLKRLAGPGARWFKVELSDATGEGATFAVADVALINCGRQ